MTLSDGVVGATIGSVVGRDHRRAFRNCQDGAALVSTPSVNAVVVTDGCGSGTSSEIGARLGARFLAELIVTFAGDADAETFASNVTNRLIDRLDLLTQSFASPKEDVIAEMMLFGFLIAAIRKDAGDAIVFGVGDGFASINGKVTVIDPGPLNAPTYPAYALLGTEIAPHILHAGPAREIDVIAVGTDGAEELLPELDRFAHEDRIFKNPSLLQKKLRVLSDRGLFFDDATLGIVRML